MMSWLARQDGYDPNAFDVPGEQTYDRRFDKTWPGQLAQDAIGAVLAPGRALQSTEPITTEQMIKPAMDMAGLVTGGSYAAPAQRGASGAGIRAYHSSPHDFNKFDLAKIGTGEGAQAYGHGLYFAESPAVSGQGGQYWQQFIHKFPKEEMRAAEALRQYGFDREATIAEMRRQMIDPRMHHTPDSLARAQAKLDILESGKPVGPRTYEVNINADPAHMLDWDKPLAAQPQAYEKIAGIPEFQTRQAIIGSDRLYDLAKANGIVGLVPIRLQKLLGEGHDMQTAFNIMRDTKGGSPQWIAEVNKLQDVIPTNEFAMRNAVPDTWPGSAIVQNTSRGLDKVRTSDILREAGIPGIKYLDEGSRISSPMQIDLIRQNIAHREALLAERPGDPTNTKWLAEYRDMLRRAENPTSNYVIFDPNIIDITKKYAVPGAIGAGGMGALAAQNKYEEGL